MDSIHKLALKGHFEHLKAEANAQTLDENDSNRRLTLLEQVNAYLLKKQQTGSLDEEGVNLMAKISKSISIDKTELPDRIPMKKAGKRRRDDQAQTGS